MPTSKRLRPDESPSSNSSARTGSSRDTSSGSTSVAQSASGNPPPLTYDDVEPVLAKLCEIPEVVLVGGQALNFWASRYAARMRRRQRPLTSTDVDFVGPTAAVHACAALLGGEARFAELDHATANFAYVLFRDRSGTERVVDFLERVCGVDSQDLSDTAIIVTPLAPTLQNTGLRFAVMHPVVCMESRLSNSVELTKYQSPHGLEQATAAIQCARAALEEFLDDGRIKAVLKLNERIFRFRRGHVGRRAAEKFGLDCFDAILYDQRLPEPFRELRYPQMQRILSKPPATVEQ